MYLTAFNPSNDELLAFCFRLNPHDNLVYKKTESHLLMFNVTQSYYHYLLFFFIVLAITYALPAAPIVTVIATATPGIALISESVSL